MFTDIINQFNHIEQRIKDTEVIMEPWPHMFIPEFFTSDFYRTVQEFEQHPELEIDANNNGRKQYAYNKYNKDYEAFTVKLFDLFAEKFDYATNVSVPATTNFWADDSELVITDIHVDAFHDTPFTISGQIYLPDDLTQRHYGTGLYTYEGDNLQQDAIQDEGTAHPHSATNEDNFKLFGRVPFYPNCMLVTTNHPHSWHAAPKIDKGDVRKSLMLRWKV
jgi:hypothetical protein|tara:strand:+ start:135 stop:794 length:660 start_codon:yes stop_codon:yes gene_type:complete